MQTQYDQVARVADVGAGISIGGFGLTLHSANEVIQIIAGLVAIIAGIAAFVFHIKRIQAIKKDKNDG